MLSTMEMKVVVHPLVLLSVVDHWQRVAKGTKKRVIGAVLGEIRDKELHVTNSFAVPFEEDPKDKSVSFLDGLYYQQLAYMFKKINTKERFVGWYSSGDTISAVDLQIHKVFNDFANHAYPGYPPVFCLVNVTDKISNSALPVKVYYQASVPSSDDQFLSTFHLIPRCSIRGNEAEEVSVEHLIKDIKETQAMSFKGLLQGHHGSIIEYQKNLESITVYLKDVASGKYPPNQAILQNIQEIITCLPDFSSAKVKEGHETIANETDLLQYIGSLNFAVISLYNLLEERSKGEKENIPPQKQALDHTS